MSRMMDIGRPTHTNQSKPVQPAIETKVEVTSELIEHAQTPTDPIALSDEKLPAEEPATDKTPKLATAGAKPREIASYAIDGPMDQKTFPLTQVLLVVGIIVVIGLVYLLLFI